MPRESKASFRSETSSINTKTDLDTDMNPKSRDKKDQYRHSIMTSTFINPLPDTLLSCGSDNLGKPGAHSLRDILVFMRQ